MRQADVVVVGGGVLGTFHAYFAARRGLKTLLLERNSMPNDASTRNFGMIVQTIVPATGEWAGYARATREVYREIQRKRDISVRVSGSIYVASTPQEDAVLREYAARAPEGVACSYLDGDKAVERYPFIKKSYCRGVLYSPDDMTLNPCVMLDRVIPYVVETAGVEYVPRTTVVSITAHGSTCTVEDASGERYDAGTVIVCTGADYKTLYPHLFRASGLRVCKLQMMETKPQLGLTLPHAILSGLSIQRYPGFEECPSYAALRDQPVAQELSDYGIHLLFKQAPDGGVIVGDSHEYSDCADSDVSLDERTTCAINDAVLDYGKTMLDLPTWEMASLWNGYYLQHPDKQIYTKTVDRGVHVVTGIAGKGMSTGAGYAKAHIAALFG